MKGVEIIKLDLIKNDERGQTFEFLNRESDKLLVVKRKKGAKCGGHYHTGKNKLKNPETLVFLSGKAEVYLENLKTGEKYREIHSLPIMFKLNPFVYHELKVIEDIMLIDMNSINDEDDTIRGKEL